MPAYADTVPPSLLQYPVVETDVLPKVDLSTLVFGLPLISAKERVVGLIPARAGSKGIPGKNTKLLGGKPLIQWTIEAAKSAKCLTQIIVTTEDPVIAHLAQELGVGVIMRPTELAQDHVQLDEVYLHAYRVMEKTYEVPDVLVMLPPTSPFRTGQHIDETYQVFLEKGCTTLSVYPDHKFHWQNDNLTEIAYPIQHDPAKRLGRQWIPPSSWMYVENAAIWIVNAQQFSLQRVVRIEPFALYTGMEESDSMDIDTPLDFWLCEQMVEWRKKVV